MRFFRYGSFDEAMEPASQGKIAVTDDAESIKRYPFRDGNHGQGPQDGDAQLHSGGALLFCWRPGCRRPRN
jgi:hypothetical protein